MIKVPLTAKPGGTHHLHTAFRDESLRHTVPGEDGFHSSDDRGRRGGTERQGFNIARVVVDNHQVCSVTELTQVRTNSLPRE